MRYETIDGDDSRINAANQTPGAFALWDSAGGHPHPKPDGTIHFFDTREEANGFAAELEASTQALPPPAPEEGAAIMAAAESVVDMRSRLKKTNWTVYLFLGVGAIAFVLGAISISFEESQFATNAGDKALTALGTLFIIALFVERAQQVYISAWRGLGRARIDRRIAGFEAALAIARRGGMTDKAAEFRKNLELQKDNLADYRQETRKIAFLGGMALGILISFIGPRILAEVIVVHGDMGFWQATFFNGADILITGGLIGGGSEGIHKVVALLTDFLDKTRQNVRNPNPVQ